MAIRRFLAAFCCIAARGAARIAETKAPIAEEHPTSHRDLQTDLVARPDVDYGEDGSCHRHVSSAPVQRPYSGQGVVFAVQSQDHDEDGLMITSVGFHISRMSVADGRIVDYLVYVLNKDGYYASPDRGMPPSLIADDAADPFDYRGDMDEWTVVAQGSITADDLVASDVTSGETRPDLVVVPFGQFRVAVPARGGIKSIYVATKTNALLYANPPTGTNVYDEADLSVAGDDASNAPRILTGEGLASWPMDEIPVIMYQTELFVGKVYYEAACPSEAPSTTASPSEAPTATPSASPSSAPTASFAPTDAPSSASSEVPSSAPSVEVVKLYDGLLLALSAPCAPGSDIPMEDRWAVADTVKDTADEGVDDDPYTTIKEVEVTSAVCVELFDRRLSTGESVEGSSDELGRRLPTASSAMDFSMVITGEYRPPTRPGVAPPRTPNLGAIAEDSINRDPEGFVKNLQERAGTSSMLQEATGVEVEAVEVEEGEPPPEKPRKPNPNPPPAPVTIEEDGDGNENALLIGIVVVVGLIVLFGAFLLYRHGERRAITNRRRKMEELEDRKEKARLEKRSKAGGRMQDPKWYAKDSKVDYDDKRLAPVSLPPRGKYYPGSDTDFLR